MEEKSKKEEVKQEEVKEKEPMKYSTAPSLLINMVRETRVYRFEMPIGAKLDECKEAVEECSKVIDLMIEQANKKQAEAEEKAKKENTEDTE